MVEESQERSVSLHTQENIRDIMFNFIPSKAIILSYKIIENGFEIQYRYFTKLRGGKMMAHNRKLRLQDIPMFRPDKTL